MLDPEFMRLYGIPSNIERSEVITGQVLFQGHGKTPKYDETDRVLKAIIGIVAVPKDSPLVDHLQYPILGKFEQTMFKDLVIELAIHEAVDPGDLKGMGLSGILKAPIWRV
jgi:hypothetical protein